MAHVEPPASRGHGGSWVALATRGGDALLCVTRLDVATRPCGHPGRALSPCVTRLDVATRPCGHPGRASPHVRRPKADRSSALVPARPGARPLPRHRGAPPCWPARVRPAERAGGLVGGRRAGGPARGRAVKAAQNARIPMSCVAMSLAPSARTSEHRQYSLDQGALRGLPAGDRAHTGRCGQKNGKAIGTLPRDASLPAARGLFRRRGALTTEPRRPGGPRGYQDGVRRRLAASKRPTWAEYRRQVSAPTQFPGDRGLRAPHV